MTEVGDPRSVHAQRDSQVIIGGSGVELRGRVGRSAAHRHISTILGKKDCNASTALDFACPIQLPDREIGIAVKAEQNARRTGRITNQKTDQALAVERIVTHAAALVRDFEEARRLKKNPLLIPPDQKHESENDADDSDRDYHGRMARGFQWLCMPGNLRQCEFPLKPSTST